MTLRYRRGMTLGEFYEMIDQHRREQGEPAAVELDCSHPFDASGIELTAHKAEGGVIVKAVYRCVECGANAGKRERLLPFRKARVRT